MGRDDQSTTVSPLAKYKLVFLGDQVCFTFPFEILSRLAEVLFCEGKLLS